MRRLLSYAGWIVILVSFLLSSLQYGKTENFTVKKWLVEPINLFGGRPYFVKMTFLNDEV